MNGNTQQFPVDERTRHEPIRRRKKNKLQSYKELQKGHFQNTQSLEVKCETIDGNIIYIFTLIKLVYSGKVSQLVSLKKRGSLKLGNSLLIRQP